MNKKFYYFITYGLLPLFIFLLLSGGAYLLISGGGLAKAQITLPHFGAAPFNASGTPNVSEQQLINAGFNSVQKQEQQGQQFIPNIAYFRVGETATWTNDKGQTESSNLVAVAVTPVKDKTWLYNNGNPEEKTYLGMYQIRDSKPGYYFVITGPDKDKIASLLNIIKPTF